LVYASADYEFLKNITIVISSRYIDGIETSWNQSSTDVNNMPIIDPVDPYQGRIADKVEDYFTLGANLHAEKLFNPEMYINANISNILD